jgi:UDP-N-acetylmuramoyl-tripeptide--D-alanyl-D-alanine ligase
VSRAGGWGGTDDVRADDVTLDRDLRARFRLSSPWGQTEVRLALHGVHQVPDALAAATTGETVHADPGRA